MRVIELGASAWRTASDFYAALLPALGAPKWHGTSANALVDSMIWGGINAVEPPYVVKITGAAHLPKDVLDEVQLAKQALAEGREDFRAREGRDVDVSLELGP